MFTMTNRIEMESLDSTTITLLAKMMYFPEGVDKITYKRSAEGLQELIFEVAPINGNTLTSTIAFTEGAGYDMAMLMDALPMKIFMDAVGFMTAWTLGGFEAAIAFSPSQELSVEFVPDAVPA